VKDTGYGMSPEVKANLFQEFGTFDTTKEGVNQQGVGLGLTISKQLVGKLGPDEIIQVQSQLQRGSEFSFVIFRDLLKKQPIQFHEPLAERNTGKNLEYHSNKTQIQKQLVVTSPLSKSHRKNRDKRFLFSLCFSRALKRVENNRKVGRKTQNSHTYNDKRIYFSQEIDNLKT
jgi:hypothetical protein